MLKYPIVYLFVYYVEIKFDFELKPFYMYVLFCIIL